MSSFDKYRNELMKRLQYFFPKKSSSLYYTSTIAEVRKVPPKNGISYNCYRLDKPIDGVYSQNDNVSHWLLYDKSKFIELEVNDIVNFKYDQFSEVKVYKNVGKARNFYPSSLQKVKNDQYKLD